MGAGAQDALNAGWTAYGQEDFAGALASFEEAARLAPGLADAHNGVGWSRLNIVDGAPGVSTLDNAVDAFGRALQADNTASDAWVGLGEALSLRRSEVADLTDAANAFANARAADPSTLYRHDYASLAQIHAAEGWSYYLAGEPALARARAEAALALTPDLGAADVLLSLTR